MYEDEFDFTPYEIKYDPEDSKKKEIVYDEKEVQELGIYIVKPEFQVKY